jgi:hypothetical protein
MNYIIDTHNNTIARVGTKSYHGNFIKFCLVKFLENLRISYDAVDKTDGSAKLNEVIAHFLKSSLINKDQYCYSTIFNLITNLRTLSKKGEVKDSPSEIIIKVIGKFSRVLIDRSI